MIKHLTISLALVAGCVPNDPELEWRLVDEVSVDPTSVDTTFGTRQAIVGGTAHAGNPETTQLLALDAQGQIIGFCTGTLVGPKLVLTAAHCVDDTIGAAGFAAYFGTDITIETDPGFRFITAAASLAVHPAWDPANVTAGNDIAVLQLADTVPITPIRVRTAPLTNADRGKPVELVGWGITGGGKEDLGVKRRVVSTMFDFDAKLIAIGDNVTNTCSGDSGGPAFFEGRVIGVTSFGDAACAQTGFDTRVDTFVDFLGAAGVDVTPDTADPTDPVDPTEPPTCDKVFGCDQNANPDRDDDSGGCSTGKGSGVAMLLVLGALLSAGRRRPRGAR
jgi:secreted trypsin-like serine protease